MSTPPFEITGSKAGSPTEELKITPEKQLKEFLKIEKIEKWGRKRMAYRVRKLREGFYVYMSIRSNHGELIKELERRLKVADPVIKYLTIRIDEEMKRQQKLAKHRERRAASRPRKPAPTSAPPAGEQTASAAG